MANDSSTLPSWSVTGQIQELKQQPNGQFMHGLTVTFQTGTGIVGNIWVSDAAATPDNIRDAIIAKLTTLHGIATLSG